ncbi:methyltransferase type 12 [[Phormidium ambiguum] IAM M-71]|uniref:Methyltransferase type 12 n=1 Tax=[Phormidium ambiguum] IAM M-71 TaxID=454136 RepID=A0A1U7ITW2_9CYAN|nr:class I SAM-dependent methyltransferase [Phormidium ambiguum]OKH40973.1 methyltransferase type 12 [Phormidium ambiguum IAM M-71]
MTAFIEKQEPERKTSEEERFQDDYYSYFESPENATRYTPSVWFLNEAFKEDSFSILDLGCGNGALNKYLPDRCDYLGIDHSEAAIKYCAKLYQNQKFVAKDFSLALPELALENQKFDAIVLAGFLFHYVDKETLELKDDRELVQFCLDKLISDRGYLVIIVPFAYGDHPAHNLYARAQWLQNLVENLLKTVKAKIVYENISLQIGLEEKVRQQKTTPDWFVADRTADYSNKYAGTYMATWTFIASPSIG